MDIDKTDDRRASDVNAELGQFELEADMLALPAPTAVAVETPLAAADEEALEAGIASMFEKLLTSDASAPDGVANDDGGDHNVEPTVALLAELNRLWAQPLAA